VAGLCAAIAGALIGVYNENASLLLTGTYTYDAISAAVVGGNAIGGGRGSILRTVVGAVLIAALSDMMLLRHYSTGWQIVAKGLIVVAFVALRRAGALAEAA
jgi:ribose/xylose/arabinose/galactoside ABC-type transport system permease subunit